MPNCLALDVGSKRTGVALSHNQIDVPISLAVLTCESISQLVSEIVVLVKQHAIDTIVVGNPLLLDGSSGKQVNYVQHAVSALQLRLPSNCIIKYIDERYTSKVDQSINKDASAALTILQIYLDQKKLNVSY